MKILIIGSSGFIGSHLSVALSKKRHQVTACDIKPGLIKEKTFILLPPENIDFSNIFNKEKYDICINASGSASVPFSLINPAEDFRLNVSNVYLLLHKIQKHQPSCRFLNFSSAAVYGNSGTLPLTEKVAPAPVSPYGFHKMLSENICNEFFKLYKISTVSLRVFSAFGPGLHKQLFWDIASKANKSEFVELYGTGQESRDFIYIDDLVEAVYKVITTSQFKGEIINVSAGEEISVKKAAETFLNFYKPGTHLRFTGIEKPGDPVHWKADISKLKGMDFEAQVPFKEGVKRYCDWLKENKTQSA